MSIFSAMCKLQCICNPFNVNNLYTRNFITLWIQDVKYWELEVFIVVDPSKYYQDHSYFCWFNALGVYLIKLQKSLKYLRSIWFFPSIGVNRVRQTCLHQVSLCKTDHSVWRRGGVSYKGRNQIILLSRFHSLFL